MYISAFSLSLLPQARELVNEGSPAKGFPVDPQVGRLSTGTHSQLVSKSASQTTLMMLLDRDKWGSAWPLLCSVAIAFFVLAKRHL